MKKTLIALAAVAATGAAFAQSSVTLSGRIDVGTGSVKTDSNVFGSTTSTSSKVTDLTGAQNVRTTSRITLSGSEDLGSGLRAGFNLETGLNVTDAASLFTGNTRTGMLSLSGNFGTVAIGTYLNSTDAVRGYSAATAGLAGGDFLARAAGGVQALGVTTGSYAGTAAAIGIEGRSRNSVAYTSPNFSGVTVSVGLVNQKNVSSASSNFGVVTAAQTGAQKLNGTSLSAAYNAGPLSARITAANAKLSDSVSGAQIGKNADTAFAVSYDLGVAKPYFLFEAVKLSGASSTQIKAASYELGATFPMGDLTPYVAINGGNHKNGAGTKIAKSSAFQVGTLYNLSKRTYAYAAFGQDKDKGELAKTYQLKRSGYAAGLVHQF
jgi:predicted porin